MRSPDLLIILLLFLSLAVSAQPVLSVPNADAVLVGDIESIRLTSHKVQTMYQVSVQPVRVLKGSILTGRSISLAWLSDPHSAERSQAWKSLVHTRALFFLRTGKPAGTYDVIRAGFYTLPMGGYFLTVDSRQLRSPFTYTRNASFETRLASELGAALEIIAVRNGSALDFHPPPFGGPFGPPSKALRKEAELFQSLTFLFNDLNPESAVTVIRYFARSTFAHLQAIGLHGELRQGNASAMLALERIMDALGRTEMASQFGFVPAASLDLHRRPAEVNALGRMAIAESAWFGFDHMAVGTLSRADTLVAVPYLSVMLDHPHPAIRKAALEGICSTLAHHGESLEMFCPVRHAQSFADSGVAFSTGGYFSNPHDAEAERGRALRTWLGIHHPELPQLKSPAWYRKAAPPFRNGVESVPSFNPQ
jgi:hypothetical protein